MKAAAKKPFEKITYKPENMGGACMSGKGMTKAEAAKIAEWAKKRKAVNTPQ